MRLLFVTTAYPPQKTGGEATVTAIHAEALVRRGHDVHVAVLRPRGPATDDERNGVQLHFRPQASIPGWSHLARRRPVRALMQRLLPSDPYERELYAIWRRWTLSLAADAVYRELGPFDVIEVPDAGAIGMRLARRNRAPLVVVPHGPGITRYSEIIGFPRTLRWRISRRQVESPMQRAALVLAPSALRAEATSGQLGDSDVPVEWCYNATDVQRWADVCDATTTAPSVLFVGRLDAVKAPEVLVDAVRDLTDIPGLEVVFVGDGVGRLGDRPYGAAIEAMAAEAGVSCRFVSWVARDELPALYEQARVVAVPSRWDTFPGVAAEALAAGRPVVCTHNVGTAPLIADAQAGGVVPADDARALGAALRPFLEDAALAAAAGRRGRALFDGPLSHDTLLRGREAAYERAIGSWRGSRDS